MIEPVVGTLTLPVFLFVSFLVVHHRHQVSGGNPVQSGVTALVWDKDALELFAADEHGYVLGRCVCAHAVSVWMLSVDAVGVHICARAVVSTLSAPLSVPLSALLLTRGPCAGTRGAGW